MTDKKWLVPDVVDPPETICVQLEIPNDTKHIAAFWGALEQLGKAYNWEDSYVEGSQTAYVWQAIIETAANFVRIGEQCMPDCNDVEDCLETSTIINIIEGDVITNETNITNNETNITENLTEITNIITGGNDTNVYPDLPTLEEPDALCGASYRVAQEIIDFVEQTILDVSAMALELWLLGLLGLGGWLSSILLIFWDYIFDNEPALTGVDFDQYLDQLAEALYCAELDRAQAIADLDPAIPTIRRDALIKGLESVTDAQVSLWAFVGSQDDTQDCSSFVCGEWCREFNYKVARQDFDLLPFQQEENAGIWEATKGWRDIYTNPHFAMLGHQVFDETEIIEVEIVVYWGALWSNPQITLYGEKTSGPSDVLATVVPDTPDQTYTLNWEGSADYVGIAVWLAHGNGPSAWLEKMTIRGTETNPWGADNC